MELELGLKITRTRDDITSFADLRVSKDHNGPVFFSRETEALFILIAHLRGFRRENINVDINKDGNRMTISGIRPVQEMALMGWVLRKKDVELRAFRKRFIIPDGVILDRIKARFKDEDSALTVVMPKSVKGIRGVAVEEVKEEEVDTGGPEATHTVVDEAIEEEVDEESPEATEPIADEAIEEEHRNLSGEEVEDVDQIEQEEEETRESEIGQNVEKYEEESNQSKEDAVQAPEQVVEEVGFEGTEEVGETYEERDNGQVILQETSMEPNMDSEGGTEKIVEEKFDNGGSLQMEDVVDQELQEEPKIEEKEEPPITIPSHPETKTMEPVQVETEKEMIPEEEDKSKKHPAMQDEDEKLETLDADEARLPPDSANQESTETIMAESESPVEESHSASDQMPKESEKQEPETNVQEPMQLKPEQVEEQAPPPVEQPTNEELHEIKEPMDEEEPDEGTVSDDEDEPTETEEQKDTVQEESDPEKKPVKKRSKLCPPLVIAGSAILVTIIVFVISWIRAKKMN